MNETELRQALIETYPDRPGHEARAWRALQARLYPPAGGRRATGGWTRWLPLALGAFGAVVLGLFQAADFSDATPSYASAESQAPGIYATSFYSKSAKAQVVWLNGLEAASDPVPAPPPAPRASEGSPGAL